MVRIIRVSLPLSLVSTCFLLLHYHDIDVRAFQLPARTTIRATRVVTVQVTPVQEAPPKFISTTLTQHHVKNDNHFQSTKLTTTSSSSSSSSSIETSNVELHVGNIDWTISTKNVLAYFTQFARIYQLDILDIQLKPTTSKPRDAGKCHGGSARLIFASQDHLQIAMDRFQDMAVSNNNNNNNNNIQEDSINGSIGNIHVRRVIHKKTTQNNNNNNNSSSINQSTILSKERILHRQKRAEKYARQRKKIAQKTDDAIHSLCTFIGQNSDGILPTLDNIPSLDWEGNMLIDPCGTNGGGLKTGSHRGTRKRAQVEAFLHVLKEALLLDHDTQNHHDSTSTSTCTCTEKSTIRTVADLGSGAGNLSLPLGWFLRKLGYKVLAIDINDKALERLSSRAKDANIDIATRTEDLFNLYQETLTKSSTTTRTTTDDENGGTSSNNYLKDCAAIVSLHACGAASDLAIAAAVQRSIPFVVSPCCIGKANTTRRPNQMPSISSSQRSAAPDIISYPRSKTVQDMIPKDEYKLILTAADYSVSRDLETYGPSSTKINQNEIVHERRGRISKTIVEMDRLKWAEERGYKTRLLQIPRLGRYYPKRQILIGSKSGTLAASRISQLSSSILQQSTTSTQLYAKNRYEDEEGETFKDSTNDDDKTLDTGLSFEENMSGLGGYLIPYAIAFFASIGVTAAFFKFVLLDY